MVDAIRALEIIRDSVTSLAEAKAVAESTLQIISQPSPSAEKCPVCHSDLLPIGTDVCLSCRHPVGHDVVEAPRQEGEHRVVLHDDLYGPAHDFCSECDKLVDEANSAPQAEPSVPTVTHSLTKPLAEQLKAIARCEFHKKGGGFEDRCVACHSYFARIRRASEVTARFAAELVKHPYRDEIAVIHGDEPSVIGKKMSAAILRECGMANYNCWSCFDSGWRKVGRKTEAGDYDEHYEFCACPAGQKKRQEMSGVEVSDDD